MKRGMKMMSRRQPSLPGFPDIPDPIEIRIPTMPWEQIGGDMDPGTHGGTIATADGDHIELLKIMPVREYVGDKEAADVGFPFWTKEAWFDLDDLNLKNDDVKSALQYTGFTEGNQKFHFEEEMTPETRALVIAEALLDYGRGDEGPSGWSKDLPDHEVKWWGDKVATLPEYLADEDESFKDDVLGYSEIKDALEKEVERMVDQSAAEGWSNANDQLVDDIAAEGYDPDSIVILAEFGDATAVNGDIDPEKTVAGLEAELEREGHEYLARFGGRVPSVEGYAYAEHVIRAVTKNLKVPVEQVEAAAKALDWWQEEIPGSSSGHTYLWAKKVGGAAVEEPRRRSARRRSR